MVELTTARLRVRPFEDRDAEAVAAYRSDPDLGLYVPWGPPYPVEKARGMIQRVSAHTFDSPGPIGIVMAVELLADSTLIGEAMIKHDNDPRLGVFGYAIARPFQRQGFATELARGLIARFFSNPDTHRITASCDARNTPSIRVLEKAGLRLEGEFRQAVLAKGQWVDERLYAMLRSEWLASHTQ